MTTINRDQISMLVNDINNGINGNVPSIIREIDESVCWAWENWDESLLEKHFDHIKPERPTYSFICEFVDNEDFEAEGYDMEELSEI